jgi:hypothetical protein
MILAYSHDVINENLAEKPTGPDEVYLVVTVAITPAEAATLIETLDSNSSTARASRDPLSRAVLDAIKESDLNP